MMMTTRLLTWFEIEDEFGPLVEIRHQAGEDWEQSAVRRARDQRRLWTRVDPGLVSTGYHYVNRQCYFESARPYPTDVEIVEHDPDLVDEEF